MINNNINNNIKFYDQLIELIKYNLFNVINLFNINYNSSIIIN